jgi:hypothetical protein
LARPRLAGHVWNTVLAIILWLVWFYGTTTHA